MVDEIEAMPRDNKCEVRSAERAVLEPIRQLVMPHAVMPAQQFPGLLREVRDYVGVLEREHTLFGFCRKLRRHKVSIQVDQYSRVQEKDVPIS